MSDEIEPQVSMRDVREIISKEAKDHLAKIEEDVRAARGKDPHYPLGETDAFKWAVAWRQIRDEKKINANGGTDTDIDGWMVAWFANCMASAAEAQAWNRQRGKLWPRILIYDTWNEYNEDLVNDTDDLIKNAELIIVDGQVLDRTVTFPGSKNDKNNHDCLAKAHPDEPKFVILGRDPDGANIVRLWADRREAAGGDPDHVAQVYAIAGRMDQWRAAGNLPNSAPNPEDYPEMPSTIVSKPDSSEETFPSVSETVEKIYQWGVDRNIIGGATSLAQYPKLHEEFGEIIEGVFHINGEEIKDGLGDTVVVMTMIAGIEGLPLPNPRPSGRYRQHSYEEIVLEAVVILSRLGGRIARGDRQGIETNLNDLSDIVAALARSTVFKIEECVAHSYDQIKDRKGVMYNGVFIKSTDERYVSICQELGKPVD